MFTLLKDVVLQSFFWEGKDVKSRRDPVEKGFGENCEAGFPKGKGVWGKGGEIEAVMVKIVAPIQHQRYSGMERLHEYTLR